MRTLYLDCGMGAAGDMLTAALLELIPEPDSLIKEFNNLGIPGVLFKKESSVKCGITGTYITVTVNGEEEESLDVHSHSHGDESGHMHTHHRNDGAEVKFAHEHKHGHSHHHSSLHDIEHIVRDHLPLPKKVRDDVMAVYQLIAEAESHVHGVPVDEIHFHEVGTMDAIADITAVCILMNRLAPDEVVVSPINVGSGQVQCAHGILPVPAPATAYILKDVPIYSGSFRGEMCMPTGAALLKHFATRFDMMPMMSVQAIGYGMGKKDFEAANCVRAMLGDSKSTADEICELSCNLDDVTGEALGYAMEQLFSVGALDVYTVPVGMKKNRPGILLHVMCREADKQSIIQAMFRYTTTIGIRESALQRHVLDRRIETMQTSYGPIRRKIAYGYGVERKKYEYDDLSRIAREKGISLSEVCFLVEQALSENQGNSSFEKKAK